MTEDKTQEKVEKEISDSSREIKKSLKKDLVRRITFVVITLVIIGLSIFIATNNSKSEALYAPTDNINKTANIDDINYDDKVNIYLFYREGCPHCRDFFSYLNGLDNETKNKFRLYGFEVWNNSDNASLMKRFQDILENTKSGTPYLIIGDQVIVGFGSSTSDKVMTALNNEYAKKSSDRYDIVKEYKNKYSSN